MKAETKYGKLNRLLIKPKEINDLPPYLRDQYCNKKMIAESVPIEILQLGADAEQAYGRLIGVNNGIEMTDYGQGLYEDKPKVKRSEDEPFLDGHEKVSQELVALFEKDLAWLKKSQESQQNDPAAAVLQLKALMAKQKGVSRVANTKFSQ